MNVPLKTVTPIGWLKTQIGELERHRTRINEALAYGDDAYSFDDIAEGVLSGRFYLHSLPNSLIILEIIQYPRMKALHGFLAAGDLEEILAAVPELEKAATQLGCSHASVAGRPGWKKVYENLGWSQAAVVMSKRLDP